jgi:polysaccharide export outer membrane protein
MESGSRNFRKHTTLPLLKGAARVFCSIVALGFPFVSIGIAQQRVTGGILAPSPKPASISDRPTAATTAIAVDASTYIISPEDSIQVTVWKEPTISGPILVRPDGMISVSLVGDLKAAGQTPAALAREITERLKKYIQDPDVLVGILAVHPKQIFLLGEVQHVGPVIMTPEMTVLQAISAAGGLTPFANSKHVYILRGTQGKQQKIPFDYKKAIKDGNQQGISLFPGDTVVVP